MPPAFLSSRHRLSLRLRKEQGHGKLAIAKIPITIGLRTFKDKSSEFVYSNVLIPGKREQEPLRKAKDSPTGLDRGGGQGASIQ